MSRATGGTLRFALQATFLIMLSPSTGCIASFPRSHDHALDYASATDQGFLVSLETHLEAGESEMDSDLDEIRDADWPASVRRALIDAPLFGDVVSAEQADKYAAWRADITIVAEQSVDSASAWLWFLTLGILPGLIHHDIEMTARYVMPDHNAAEPIRVTGRLTVAIGFLVIPIFGLTPSFDDLLNDLVYELTTASVVQLERACDFC